LAEDRLPLRFLLACPACKRQFDAGGLPPGSLFQCSCGRKIRVPRVEVRDAAVVRCSSCGAPRTGHGESCPHCGSDFTLHERDLHTICPGCATRISDKARFCHNCALPIAPQGRAGEATDSPCPACGDHRKLHSRQLGADEMSVLECRACGGLWLGHETFRLLAERARSVAAWDTIDEARPSAGTDRPATHKGPLYRRCPVCRRMMNRRNFARRSRVILDTCKDHGWWFDLRELEQLLVWIRDGGEARERRRAEREQQDRRSKARLDRVFVDRLDRMAGRPASTFGRGDSQSSDLLGQLLGALFDS